MWSKAPAPTKQEGERIAAAKVGACICCLILCERGELEDYMVVKGGDYHHFKSGNKRIGHHAGICLCVYHHRGYPLFSTVAMTRKRYGWSLADGSRKFHEIYGSDAELLEKQNKLLEGEA